MKLRGYNDAFVKASQSTTYDIKRYLQHLAMMKINEGEFRNVTRK